MANQIEVTVYQIDGCPQKTPILVSFLTSDIMIKDASIFNIPAVKSALIYYRIINNKLQVQYYYVSETLEDILLASNQGSTTQIKVTVLAIDDNIQIPGGVHYSFPTHNISIWGIADASIGSNSFIEYKQIKYKLLESIADLVSSSNLGGINGYRGSFYDTTTQTVTSGAVKAMELNTTDSTCTYGFSITNNTLGRPTRITAGYSGVYNLQFSAQLNRPSGGGGTAKQVDIWIAINGTNVPYSTTGITMQANDNKIVAAWNFFVKLNAGQYVELMWTQDDLINILADVAGANFPETPSVIATINQVG